MIFYANKSLQAILLLILALNNKVEWVVRHLKSHTYVVVLSPAHRAEASSVLRNNSCYPL